MRKTITFEKVVTICDYCHEEIHDIPSTDGLGSEYHVLCHMELKEMND